MNHFLFSFLFFPGVLHAGGHPADSLLPLAVSMRTPPVSIRALPVSIRTEEEEEPDLQAIEDEYNSTRNNRRTLLHLYRALKLRRAFADRRIRYKALYDLASVSVRLKLYPLAMSCYYKTLQLQDSLTTEISDSGFPASFPVDTTLAGTGYSVKDSPPVSNESITASFEDTKPASAYALILQVKQPVTGRRTAFTHINNVGHMFITLIKYNDDHTCVARSFGFYPKKDGLFSATPLRPSSSSVFKDDAFHDWDELVGKFISAKRFERILRLLQRYDQRPYHLSQNNCTDFGLSVAAIGGISIRHTEGNWPLGKGNNPANAGQSILEGQITNMDATGREGIFISLGPSSRLSPAN